MHARVWLVLHVLAAIGGMGPEIAFGLMAPRARRAGRPDARAVYHAIAHARRTLVVPAIVVQIGSGVALIWLRGGSMPSWLSWSLVLYGVALAVVAVVLVPAGRRMRAALADGSDDPDISAIARVLALGGAIAGTMLITVAVLMVAKP